MLPGIGRIAFFAAEKELRLARHACFANWAEPRASCLGSVKRPLARWPFVPFQSHFLVRAEIGDEGDGSKRERVPTTLSQVLKASSQRHELWPGDAVGAASSQRSKVSSLLLEKLAQAVAEIEEIRRVGISKAHLDAMSEGSVAVVLWRLPAGGLA